MLVHNLLWSIVTFISTIAEMLVFRFILQIWGQSKHDRFKENCMISILVCIIIVLTILNINPNIKLIIAIFGAYLFSLYNYKFSILNLIVINLVFWMILMGLDAVAAGLVMVINNLENITDALKNNMFRLELITLSKCMLVSIMPISNGFKIKMELKKSDFINIVIPIVGNILSLIVIFGLIMNSNRLEYGKNLIILIISIVLFLSNLSLINIIIKIIKSNNIQMENKIIKEKIKMQYKYYLTINENQLKVRKLYHDINNHMNCIHHLYEKNEDPKQYIDSIKKELKSFNLAFSTGNMVLDSILNDKKEICDKNSIKFDANINFAKCDFIEVIDICSIFANILDNAIEACTKISNDEIDKFIFIKGNIVGENFTLKCENSKSSEIKSNSSGAIKTSKKDTFLHGIGINSIKNSVHKYNGAVVFNYSTTKFLVDMYIPLNYT